MVSILASKPRGPRFESQRGLPPKFMVKWELSLQPWTINGEKVLKTEQSEKYEKM